MHKKFTAKQKKITKYWQYTVLLPVKSVRKLFLTSSGLPFVHPAEISALQKAVQAVPVLEKPGQQFLFRHWQKFLHQFLKAC